MSRPGRTHNTDPTIDVDENGDVLVTSAMIPAPWDKLMPDYYMGDLSPIPTASDQQTPVTEHGVTLVDSYRRAARLAIQETKVDVSAKSLKPSTTPRVLRNLGLAMNKAGRP